MPEIRVEDIIDHLDREFRKALKETVSELIPNCTINERILFKVFKKKIYKKCRIWESVPDSYIRI